MKRKTKKREVWWCWKWTHGGLDPHTAQLTKSSLLRNTLEVYRGRMPDGKPVKIEVREIKQ